MYAKHGNHVNADASGNKASTKHLESHLEHRHLFLLAILHFLDLSEVDNCPLRGKPIQQFFRWYSN